jgi:hypothetical protein
MFIGMAAVSTGAQSQPASGSSQMSTAAGEFSWKDFISPAGAQAKLPPVGHPGSPGLKTPDSDKSSACYSIRDYQFSRTPDSNVMKPSGYSECEPASKFQLKEILTTHK